MYKYGERGGRKRFNIFVFIFIKKKKKKTQLL